MSSAELPQTIVIRSLPRGQYLRYINNPKQDIGLVTNAEPSISNLFCKIEVERAKVDRKYVNLRFSRSNKYWGREEGGSRLRATSNKAEEDLSKPFCTLFEPISRGDGNFSFIHVQSGGFLTSPSGQGKEYIFIGDKAGVSVETRFHILDWDSLVLLPKYVAFKGDNDKYLKATWIESYRYLQFSSDDGNEIQSGYEVTTAPDGHLRFKSNYFGLFWRRSPNWIWADSPDTTDSNKDTLFWPVKVSGNVIALRNAGNNQFCKRLTTEGKTSCLNAGVGTITTECKMQVEELVLNRQIYDIKYHLDDARIFDEVPVVTGKGSAVNNSDNTNSLSVKVLFTEEKSSTFTNSLSLTLGVKTTISTQIPLIANAGIEISAEISNVSEWGKTETTITSQEVTYTAVVPPRSSVKVYYIATKGHCNVPFSYTQRDQLSSDGSFVTAQHIDGTFTGVNYYNFDFTQPEIKPLPPSLYK